MIQSYIQFISYLFCQFSCQTYFIIVHIMSQSPPNYYIFIIQFLNWQIKSQQILLLLFYYPSNMIINHNGYQQSQQNLPRVQNVSCVLPPTKNLGGLYIGNYFGAQNVQILKQYGIRAVLTTSIQTPVAYLPEDIPFHKKIDAHDKQNFYIKDHFKQCLDFMEEYRKITNVFVHCYAGMSRSAAMVIAYLMKTHNWTYENSFNFLKFKRSIINPNQGFVQQLKAFEKQLNGTEQKMERNIEVNNNGMINAFEFQSLKVSNPSQQLLRSNNNYFPDQTQQMLFLSNYQVNNPSFQNQFSPGRIDRFSQYDMQKNYKQRSNSAQNMYNTEKYGYQHKIPQQQTPQIISAVSEMRVFESQPTTISTRSTLRTYHDQIPIPKFGTKKQSIPIEKQRSKINKEILLQDKKKTILRQSKAGFIRPRDLPGYKII